MIAQVHTGCVDGVEALLVRVEVALASALPAFTVVGLAQGSVREGRERVTAAMRASGFALPPRRITVNLAPADVQKAGTAFDLPIAVGILTAAGIVPEAAIRDVAFLGELGLDGRLRPVSSVLPVALQVRAAGIGTLVVPRGCETEAWLADGLKVCPYDDLQSVVAALCAEGLADRSQLRCRRASPGPDARMAGFSEAPIETDLSDVVGQLAGKRALEVAAAGGHHLLMTGPPGSGKTMLARRLPALLPPLTSEEALEVARLRSLAGMSVLAGGYRAPPFRAPHHSVSYAGLVGGGRPLRPGEISLAHRGVLFLDELPEFRRDAIEVLRQPLERGSVVISRSAGSVTVPCDFLLVAAMNPCPCGYLGDARNRCCCDPRAVQRYRNRVSGPLLDRLDLVVEMPALPVRELVTSRPTGGRASPHSTAAVAERVAAARAMSRERGRDPGADQVETPGQRLLEAAASHGLSARGYHRVLRVSRTIADLSGSDSVRADHVAEALHFRAPILSSL